MGIKQAVVKYRGATSRVNYVETSNGNLYFYGKHDGKDGCILSNGKIIVTPELMEAVDSGVRPSHIGLVSPEGELVIPCDNKAIKRVNDSVIVVVKATPTSPSVLEAIEKKNDPNTAASLVSIAASIKNRLNPLIGTDGQYLVNDLFSEATICDATTGNNLIGDDSTYSFVCESPSANKLFMCGNTPDSELREFSLSPVLNNQSQEIDVNTAAVATEVVEDALNSAATVAETEATNAVEGNEVVADSVVPETVAAESNVETPPAPADVVETPEETVNNEVQDTVSETVAEPEVASNEVTPDTVTNEVVATNETVAVPDVVNNEVQDTVASETVATPEVASNDVTPDTVANETNENVVAPEEANNEIVDDSIAPPVLPVVSEKDEEVVETPEPEEAVQPETQETADNKESDAKDSNSEEEVENAEDTPEEEVPERELEFSDALKDVDEEEELDVIDRSNPDDEKPFDEDLEEETPYGFEQVHPDSIVTNSEDDILEYSSRDNVSGNPSVFDEAENIINRLIADNKAKAEVIRSQRDAIDAQNKKLEKYSETLKTARNDLKRKAQEFEGIAKKYRASNEQLKKRVVTLSEKNASLASENEQLRTTNAQLRATFDGSRGLARMVTNAKHFLNTGNGYEVNSFDETDDDLGISYSRAA